jgi:hypothetical protein
LLSHFIMKDISWAYKENQPSPLRLKNEIFEHLSPYVISLTWKIILRSFTNYFRWYKHSSFCKVQGSLFADRGNPRSAHLDLVGFPPTPAVRCAVYCKNCTACLLPCIDTDSLESAVSHLETCLDLIVWCIPVSNSG